jgi:hypothetical protein
MRKSVDNYEDAKENEDGTVPESVIQETLPLHPQPRLIIPETQVSPSFPDSLAIFLASLFDSIVPPSFPEAITHDSLDPPPLPVLQDKVITETQEDQEADCQSSSEDSANELL